LRGVDGSTPQALKAFARAALKGMRTEVGSYRRDHLRALAQRVEVDAKAYAGRRIRRKIGRFWSARFRTQVERTEGVEPSSPVWKPSLGRRAASAIWN
jgi:hypothetical protein